MAGRAPCRRPAARGLSAGAQRAASSVYGGHDPGGRCAHVPSPSSSASTPPAAGPALPTPPHTPTAKARVVHTSHNALHCICNAPRLIASRSRGGRGGGGAGVGAPALAAWKQWGRRQWPDSAQQCLANCEPRHKRPKQTRTPRPPRRTRARAPGQPQGRRSARGRGMTASRSGPPGPAGRAARSRRRRRALPRLQGAGGSLHARGSAAAGRACARRAGFPQGPGRARAAGAAAAPRPSSRGGGGGARRHACAPYAGMLLLTGPGGDGSHGRRGRRACRPTPATAAPRRGGGRAGRLAEGSRRLGRPVSC